MVTYNTIRLEREVAEQIRRLTRQLSAAADADVTQSDAVGAAVGYALEHLAEVAPRLQPDATNPPEVRDSDATQ